MSPGKTLLCLLGLIASLALADCECGYSISTDDDSGYQVFTDLLESDFLHVDYFKSASRDMGWARQEYNVSRYAARGAYGESFVASNLRSNEIGDKKLWSGDGKNGGAGGLQLVVESDIVNNRSVRTAEVATTSLQYFYGTFRAGIKVTDVPGTYSAFFWYFNNTQEIDMEFLSAEFNRDNNTFPVNLVLQTPESRSAGYDASKTGTFVRTNLPFDPTDDFHEYRFDFLSERVLFYADGNSLSAMNGSGVPTTTGSIHVSHWSDGNPGWSQGPPKEDAITTISYVKAYFNSSEASRKNDYKMRCKDTSSSTAICAIPDNNSTFFFTYEKNMTGNQTTYGDDDSSSHAGATELWGSFLLFMAVVSTAFSM